MGEGDGEELVRAARWVVLAREVGALHDVVETVPLRIPEALIEGVLATRGVRGKGARRFLVTRSARPALEEPKRVVPQGVDLHGLPAPRRHHPAVALGVHPGELIALRPLDEEAVLGIDVDAKTRAREVTLHDFRELRHEG